MNNGERILTDDDGNKRWFLNGQFHRTDGPAVEYTDGHKVWYLNNKFYGNGDLPPVDFTLAVLILHGISE